MMVCVEVVMNGERVIAASGRRERTGLRWRCLEALQKERRTAVERLERTLGRLRTADEDRLTGDAVDRATATADGVLLRATMERDQTLVGEIDHALEKLARGGYGVCEGSGEPIEPARLLARPWTRYSRAYVEEREEERRTGT